MLGAARARAAAALAAAAEEAFEEVLEDGPEADVLAATPGAHRPEAVVLRALVRIGQHGIGLVDFLEALLGGLVPGVLVGVVHPRELAVGALERGLVGIARDTEDRVEVLGGHARRRPRPTRRCRRRRSSPR